MNKNKSFFSDFCCHDCFNFLSTCLIRKKTFIDNQKYLLEKYQEHQNELSKNQHPEPFENEEFLEDVKLNIKEENEHLENLDNCVFIKEEPLSDDEDNKNSFNLNVDCEIEEIGSTIAVHLSPCKICGKMLRKGSMIKLI